MNVAPPVAPRSRPSRPSQIPSARPVPGSVLVITPWYAGSAGGVAVSTETISAALTAAGNRVVTLVLNGQTRHTGRFGEEVYPLTVYGREVLKRGPRGWAGYLKRWLDTGRLLIRLIRQYDIGVAHFNFCAVSFGPIKTWLRILRIPMVITFRGSDINSLARNSLEEAVAGELVDASSSVTAISAPLLEAVVKRFPSARRKSAVVHNPVPVDVWNSGRADEPVVERDIDILFLGNLLPVKGPDQLLSAFAMVARQLPTATLAFVGSGSMEPELRAEAETLGLGDRVTFNGRARREDVPAWLHRARVLALPSRAEGFGLVAIEAQHLGVPVVGTAVGGIVDAVAHGESGLLVPDGDTRALADALVELLSDDARREAMGQAGRQRVARLFSPARMASEYSSIYRSIMPAGDRREASDLMATRL